MKTNYLFLNTHELIQSCLKGDPKAEKQLFCTFAGRVLALCKRYCRKSEDARDLMQECFIHVFDRLPYYNPKKGVFEAWLHRVCTNLVLQYLRKQKVTITLTFPTILPEFGEVIEADEMNKISDEAILESIWELPNGYREIVNLYIFEGLKHKEIANYLNISEGTSRSQYTRAKKLLKTILQEKASKKTPNYG